MSLLQLKGLSKQYGVPKPGAWFGSARLKAVDGVDLVLAAGETVGVVGESGSGKSTLAKMAMALETPDAGQVLFDGQELFKLGSRELRAQRRHFQMVFQDPMASINPRHRAFDVVTEPIQVHEDLAASALEERASALMREVGLEPSMLTRYPHEFSGGQRQRLMIARAVSTRPKLLVADEPVSSLDITIQAQILNLLLKLKKDLGMAMLFISHDLRVVERLSDRVAVMKEGKILELAPAKELYLRPSHDYTKALLAASLPLPAGIRQALGRS